MGKKKLRTSTKNLVRYRNLCDLCGIAFNCARPDARFCTTKCKQADYRIRKAANVLAREHVAAEEAARLKRLAQQADAALARSVEADRLNHAKPNLNTKENRT